jgi:hypothetical protein
MIRKSMTEWQGDGPSGSGSLSTEANGAAFVQDALAATAASQRRTVSLSAFRSHLPIRTLAWDGLTVLMTMGAVGRTVPHGTRVTASAAPLRALGAGKVLPGGAVPRGEASRACASLSIIPHDIVRHGPPK